MFNNITRESFRIDFLVPAAQTTTLYVTTELLRRFGKYALNNRTAVMVGGVTSLVASFANNYFKDPSHSYASFPVGIGTGIIVHYFFYPHVALKKVIDMKGVVLIAAVITAVKLIIENFSMLKKQEEKIGEFVLSLLKDDEEKVEDHSKQPEKAEEHSKQSEKTELHSKQSEENLVCPE